MIWFAPAALAATFEPAGRLPDYAALPGDDVGELAIDGQGRVWVPTDRGISTYDPATGTWRGWGREEGLPTSGSDVQVASDGAVWFGKQVRLDPATGEVSRYTFPDDTDVA